MNTVDIGNYVTNENSKVFAIKNLPEEVVAFLFARYSRSNLSLKEDLINMLKSEGLDSLVESNFASESPSNALVKTQDKARQFAEKYIVGYGHSSVAEHACVHLALEDISLVASKVIEDARLASYTEKSTRYVKFDTTKMASADNIGVVDLANLYEETTKSLMQAYLDWQDPFVEQIKKNTPKKEKQTENGYNSSCRSTAFDSLRYLLPAATHTNIGMTVNARTLEHMLIKMNSHYLAEVRELAAMIKEEAEKIVPTLLKYTDKSDFLEEEYLRQWRGVAVEDLTCKNDAVLFEPCYSEEDMLKLLCAPYPPQPGMVTSILSDRGKRDNFTRHFERVSMTFVMHMDFGAYRDIQRHRMATLTMEPFEPAYGYEVPRGVKEYGFYDKYVELMEKAKDAYDKLDAAGWNYEAQYVLPLAYRVKVTATMNLRELQHFIELRSSRQGHYSYRNIAQKVFKIVEEKYPTIAKEIRVNMEDYSLTRDEK